MTVLQAIILGFVQGITEFLPISSSGHLIVLPQIFGWGSQQPLVFDTVLHFGTALALVVYFWRDLWNLVPRRLAGTYHSMSLLLVGSIPAGIIGFLFGDFFEIHFREVSTVATFLILGSVLMTLAEVFHRVLVKTYYNMSLSKGFMVGLFQALALLPGVSRSGSTISGGMFLGLSREEATKFSFLLSIPIVIVASGYKILHSYNQLSFDLSLLSGFVSSFIVGLFAITFLMSFVRRHSLYWFVGYRISLAVILLMFFT